MEIVLYQPEIPQNTGNIVRTCSVTHTSLTLVRPLGFSVSSKVLKRAGLDYWDEVNIHYVDHLMEYLLKCNRPFYFFSSKVKTPYTDISFTSEDLLIFGSETSGLPQEFFTKWLDKFYTIPMAPQARCLNLSNSVSVVLYEALRQQKFQPLLHSYSS
jgi:tRNA (cytidine/uridine-2'-O-)-methyltransferase